MDFIHAAHAQPLRSKPDRAPWYRELNRRRDTNKYDNLDAAPARARTDAAHEARAAQVAEAATEAATDNREAAEAWDALATHAAKHAGACRHGAALAERTRRRWPR